MEREPRRSAVAWATLGLLALAAMAGCSDAKSEPLELTYYYLPG